MKTVRGQININKMIVKKKKNNKIIRKCQRKLSKIFYIMKYLESTDIIKVSGFISELLYSDDKLCELFINKSCNINEIEIINKIPYYLLNEYTSKYETLLMFLSFYLLFKINIPLDKSILKSGEITRLEVLLGGLGLLFFKFIYHDVLDHCNL